MRAELQQQIAQIKEAAARFSQMRLAERAAIEADARLIDERRRGAEGVAATVRIGPCRPRLAPGEAPVELPGCAEDDAIQAAVFTSIPVHAAVVEVTPQARFDGDTADSNERRLPLGARPAARTRGRAAVRPPGVGRNAPDLSGCVVVGRAARARRAPAGEVPAAA
jgi:hypothetical protein